MARTIDQTATYSFTTPEGAELQHGAAYNACFPGHSIEPVGLNHDGTVEHMVEGVIMPDYLEQLFDTDEQVLSYYQVQPLKFADDYD